MVTEKANLVCQSIQKLEAYAKVAQRISSSKILLYLYVLLKAATAEELCDIMPTEPKKNMAAVDTIPMTKPPEKNAR